MKQFLIIQKSSPIKDYIELYLAAFNDIAIVSVESISDSIRLFDKNPIYDCIFIGNSLTVDGEAKDLTNKIKDYVSTHAKCKVIGTNKGLSTQDWVFYVPSMAPPFKIIDAVRYGLSLPEDSVTHKYATVPIFCLNYFKEAPCDIFFRIGSNPQDATYVKRFNEKDSIDSQDISRYVEKNVKQIFILSERLDEFSSTISTKIVKKVSSLEGDVNQLDVATEALDYASHFLKSHGINAHSQKIAQEVITNILSSVEKMDKKKAKLFNDILNTKEDFYHKHVSLTALLASSVLEELKWDTSEDSHSALTCAAYFHNFFISEEADISCVTNSGLNQFDSEEKRAKIHDHAQLAASFVKDLKSIPYDVPMLILEHHGSTQGVGFPDQKRNSSQLSSLFMIVNEFALQFLINNESNSAQTVQDLLRSFLSTYGSSNRKILEAMQNCITGHMAE